MSEEVKKFKPMRDDLLVVHRNFNDFTETPIRLLDDEDKTTWKFFEVLEVGPDVKSVNVGDVIIVPWAKVMIPFMVESIGQRCTITNEKEVWAVVDYV